MSVKSLGNLAALRTFRVLRALKTVAVVPGESRGRRQAARSQIHQPRVRLLNWREKTK